MSSRKMVGGDGAHSGEHRETPYCEYMRCTPDDPNAICDQEMQHRTCVCPESARCDTCDPPPLTTVKLEAKPSAYDPPPKHYDGGAIDAWAVWDAFDLDPWAAALTKYILRAGKKEGESKLKDLRKARNYLAYMIEREERREP